MFKRKVDHPQNASLNSSDHDYVQAFRERQRQDFARAQQSPTDPVRQRQVQGRYHTAGSHHASMGEDTTSVTDTGSDKLAWRDSEGERLEDFGVDEEIDLYDEDDIPLAELIRRRTAIKQTKRA